MPRIRVLPLDVSKEKKQDMFEINACNNNRFQKIYTTKRIG